MPTREPISAPFHPAVSCAGKVPHRTKEKAQRHAVRMRRRYGDRLKVYKCLYADHWHIGHGADSRGVRRPRYAK